MKRKKTRGRKVLVQRIDLKNIEQTENSRTVYKENDLADLMHSMKQDGLLQAIGVMHLPNGKYECVFGNRRLVAAKKLGWADIPATVLDIEGENSRDFVNLLENMKRQNTTVAEDGRIFQALKDRGLSEKEIAARLNIKVERVELALEIIGKGIPQDIQRKIVNRVDGQKRPNTISATAAAKILAMRKEHKLNRKQTRALMSYASQDDTNLSQVAGIAPMLKAGHSVQSAIKVVDRMVRVVMYVYIDENQIEKLEKQHEASITEILWRQLEANKKLGIMRLPQNKQTKDLFQVERRSIK